MSGLLGALGDVVNGVGDLLDGGSQPEPSHNNPPPSPTSSSHDEPAPTQSSSNPAPTDPPSSGSSGTSGGGGGEESGGDGDPSAVNVGSPDPAPSPNSPLGVDPPATQAAQGADTSVPASSANLGGSTTSALEPSAINTDGTPAPSLTVIDISPQSSTVGSAGNAANSSPASSSPNHGGLSGTAAGVLATFIILLSVLLAFFIYRHCMIRRRKIKRARMANSWVSQHGERDSGGWDFHCDNNSNRSSDVSFVTNEQAQMQTIPATAHVTFAPVRHISLPPAPSPDPDGLFFTVDNAEQMPQYKSYDYDLERNQRAYSGTNFDENGSRSQSPVGLAVPMGPHSPVLPQSGQAQSLSRNSSLVDYVAFIEFPQPPAEAHPAPHLAPLVTSPFTPPGSPPSRPTNPAAPPLSPVYAPYDDPFASPQDGAIPEPARSSHASHSEIIF